MYHQASLVCWACGKSIHIVMPSVPQFAFEVAQAANEVGWLGVIDTNRHRALVFCSESCRVSQITKQGVYRNRPKVVPQPPNAVEAVVAVLRSPHRAILLLHRHADDPTFSGWCLPGGRVEASDLNFISAAIREVREETGRLFPGIEDLSVFHSVSPKTGEEFRIHAFLIDCECFEPTLSPEHTSARWFSPEEIGTALLAGPATHRIIEHVRALEREGR